MSEEKVLIVYIRNTVVNKSSFYLPHSIDSEYVEKVNLFCERMKVFENGEFYPKKEKYYFKVYPEYSSNQKNQFFVIIGTTRKYKEKNVENFYDDLFTSFKIENIEPKENGDIDKMVIKLMIQSFNKFLKSKSEPNIGFSSNSRALNLNLNSPRSKSIELMELNDEINDTHSNTTEDEINDLAIGKRVNDSKKEIGNKLNKKEVKKKKGTIDWWKNLKVLFVLSCFICTLALYISMPFLMNYKRKHLDNKEDEENKNNSEENNGNSDKESDIV